MMEKLWKSTQKIIFTWKNFTFTLHGIPSYQAEHYNNRKIREFRTFLSILLLNKFTPIKKSLSFHF